MKLKPVLLSLIILLFLSGCYQKFLSFVFTDREIEIVRIHGKYPEIEIFDLRQQISEKEIKRPGLFALPGWKDMAYPKLTEEHKKEINKGINRQFTNEGENYKVTCILRNSMQKISVGFFQNRLFATVELEIYLNDDRDKLIESYRTTEYLEFKTGTMLKNDIDLLYNKTLRNAVHICFINFKKLITSKVKMSITEIAISLSIINDAKYTVSIPCSFYHGHQPFYPRWLSKNIRENQSG